MARDRIFLIGFRGTGKTTVGRILAARLGWSFVDCDELIETRFGKSISEVFAIEGEPAFRDCEAQTLRELANRPRTVIATGGGAILSAANRVLLRDTGFVAWLVAKPEVIWKRLQADPTTSTRRPMLTPFGGLNEVNELLTKRESLYRETADFAFDADAPSPEAVADAIFTSWSGSPLSRSSGGAAAP